MSSAKHVFVQNVPALGYMALGDACVRLLAIRAIVERYGLDALLVPLAKEPCRTLARRVFGPRAVEAVPAAYAEAVMHAPTALDHFFGGAGHNVFETVFWENGFFDTAGLTIPLCDVLPCSPMARAVMIYPLEKTDANRIFDADWWIAACRQIQAAGYKLHHAGHRHERLQKLYDAVAFDRVFEPSLQGLFDAIAASSLMIGSSTGPTWLGLFSAIPQVVLESRRSSHRYWDFDRVKPVLCKDIRIGSHLSHYLR